MKAFAGSVLTTAATLALVAVPGVAYAGPTDAAAFTQYAAIVAADTRANLADTASAAGDNITCEPQPLVDGRMLTPRAGVVVGEVFATVEVHAHWACTSLDTGESYTIDGTVYDVYFDGGYVMTRGGTSTMAAVAGAATTNPVGTVQYAGGSGALNTWHFAHFEGTTTTGRHAYGDSPLFYVMGV